MIKITYFVHGTTTHNEMGIAAGWLPGELSNLGIKQSIELGNIVSNKKFDVILKDKSWRQAIVEDWRLTKSWKPGWEYYIWK